MAHVIGSHTGVIRLLSYTYSQSVSQSVGERLHFFIYFSSSTHTTGCLNKERMKERRRRRRKTTTSVTTVRAADVVYIFAWHILCTRSHSKRHFLLRQSIIIHKWVCLKFIILIHWLVPKKIIRSSWVIWYGWAMAMLQNDLLFSLSSNKKRVKLCTQLRLWFFLCKHKHDVSGHWIYLAIHRYR